MTSIHIVDLSSRVTVTRGVAPAADSTVGDADARRQAVDPRLIAELVYRMMRDELAIGRERG